MTTTARMDAILAALVLGGQELGRQQGARKVRRRVPKKQERLARLVTQHCIAGIPELSHEFQREWQAIHRRRQGEWELVQKREFFRNMADLAGRVNAALLAGYRVGTTSSRMLQLTSNQFLGLMVDHQAFTIAWHEAATLPDLEACIEEPSGDHLALRTATQKATSPTGTPSPVDLPPGTQQADEPLVNSPTPLHELEQAPTPSNPASVAPEPESACALELEVTENPITGRWTFELQGQQVEVDPRLGYVRFKGAPLPLASVRGLTKPEELAGAPLSAIARLLEDEH